MRIIQSCSNYLASDETPESTCSKYLASIVVLKYEYYWNKGYEIKLLETNMISSISSPQRIS